MPQPTHDNVAPLVADLQESGRSVRVTFRCPVSGQSVKSSHSVPRNRNTSAQLTNTAKRSMMYGLQSAVNQTIRSVFGYSTVGRVAGDVARQAMYSATSAATNQNTLSSSEKRDAVIEAFKKVSRQFVWDSARGHWISAKAATELMSAFEQQLANHPLTHGYDRTVLARMLIEIARADGRLSGDESSWLNELIGPDVGSIADLSSRPPLSDAELNEASRGDARVTLLMLAWTMAIVDENFDSSEKQVLQGFARGLKLSNAQIKAARDHAQGYILDQALERMFTWGGHDAHARSELFALAQRLGMSQQEAQVAEARYQRRKGA